MKDAFARLRLNERFFQSRNNDLSCKNVNSKIVFFLHLLGQLNRSKRSLLSLKRFRNSLVKKQSEFAKCSSPVLKFRLALHNWRRCHVTTTTEDHTARMYDVFICLPDLTLKLKPKPKRTILQTLSFQARGVALLCVNGVLAHGKKNWKKPCKVDGTVCRLGKSKSSERGQNDYVLYEKIAQETDFLFKKQFNQWWLPYLEK